MQVGSGCGVTGGTRGMPRGFAIHALRCSVRIQRSHALQIGRWGAVHELPCGLNGCAWPKVFTVSHLEEWKNCLSALDREPGYDSQLVHRQFEVGRSRRHSSLLLTRQASQADPSTAWAVTTSAKVMPMPVRSVVANILSL